MLLSQIISSKLKQVSRDIFGVDIPKLNLETYKNSNFGHYSTSLPIELSKKIGKSPNEISQIIIDQFYEDKTLKIEFEKIENVNGFINFYLRKDFIFNYLASLLKEGKLGQGDFYSNQKVVLEYTDPNPFKQFHMGHFMTNALGESVFRLIQRQGADAINVCYSGDVGIHVAKTIYSVLLKIENKEYSLEDYLNFSNKKTIEQLGDSYVKGSQMYQNEEDKIKIQDLSSLIFKISQKLAKDQGITPQIQYSESKFFEKDIVEKIYDKGRDESISYFKEVYKKLGTNFKELFFESVTGEIGYEIVKNNSIFEHSEGAIIWDGKKFGKNVQVLINGRGNPTYSTKDLGLNVLKKAKYNPDLSIIFTAREQEFYFNDLIEIFKQLGFTQETIHIPHGELRNKSGKMSSRTGDIVTLDEILDQIKQEVLINFSSKKDQVFLEQISDKIAIASLKYLILKNSIGSNIIYDPKSITDLTGNTGAYLLYTYARTNSLINKSEIFEFSLSEDFEINELEKKVLVKSLMFNEILKKYAIDLSPSILANYLFELAKDFNHFYNENKILGDNKETTDFRMFLTLLTNKILQEGMYQLGIEPLESL